MRNWKITYWDNFTLREITVFADIWSLPGTIATSAASPYIQSIIKIEVVPS